MNEQRTAQGGRGGPTIRRMELDDLAEVFHLGERLFTSREAPNLYRVWDEFEVVSYYDDEPEHCFVAQVDDRVAGFALCTTVAKARSAWKYGYLAWMGVASQSQRQGIGTRLFNAFRQAMLRAGARMLLVDTSADNTRALEFFGRFGFGHPEDHVYLTLNLSRPRRTDGLSTTRERGDD
jgi:ribosomal protein S18 acetylase RimI-like enzyme